MSEQEQNHHTAYDDREPGEERKAALAAAYQQNVTQNKPPYATVWIQTYGELSWIFKQHGWSCAASLLGGKTRPDLRETVLSGAHLEGIYLTGAHLEGANLIRAHLDGTDLVGAHLQGASLSDAQMKEANLRGAQMEGTNLGDAHLEGAILAMAQMEGANLAKAQLAGADLTEAQLTRANLTWAHLEGANLTGAQMAEADLRHAHLSNTNLTYAVMNSQTELDNVKLGSGTKLGDIKWNGVYLTRVDWNQVTQLGDEQVIVVIPDRQARIDAYRDAARAYRGLRVELKNQGLVLPASRFRLREQQLERRALRVERHMFSWFGSWLLDKVAGYGERPARIFISYMIVVSAFAVAYFGVTHVVETGLSQLSWDEALVLSLTSFHGRGFFPGFLSLGDWVSRLAAAEAVIGLFIELMLIATFSRRFLGD